MEYVSKCCQPALPSWDQQDSIPTLIFLMKSMNSYQAEPVLIKAWQYVWHLGGGIRQSLSSETVLTPPASFLPLKAPYAITDHGQRTANPGWIY